MNDSDYIQLVEMFSTIKKIVKHSEMKGLRELLYNKYTSNHELLFYIVKLRTFFYSLTLYE